MVNFMVGYFEKEMENEETREVFSLLNNFEYNYLFFVSFVLCLFFFFYTFFLSYYCYSAFAVQLN